MSTISTICREFSPHVGIETGTYLGSSTPYLAAMVSEAMHTIEIDPAAGALANERFKRNHPQSKIYLRMGDSVSEIVKILENVDPKSKRVIAYLDAHWYEAVPTTKEIEALINWGGSWIAIIDDFRVDSDPLYKFDVYGSIEIGPSILPATSGISLYVTNQPAFKETGRRKGTGYVCKLEDESVLASLSELVKVLRKF
jgi:cephalosporin hydroxylase